MGSQERPLRFRPGFGPRRPHNSRAQLATHGFARRLLLRVSRLPTLQAESLCSRGLSFLLKQYMAWESMISRPLRVGQLKTLTLTIPSRWPSPANYNHPLWLMWQHQLLTPMLDLGMRLSSGVIIYLDLVGPYLLMTFSRGTRLCYRHLPNQDGCFGFGCLGGI